MTVWARPTSIFLSSISFIYSCGTMWTRWIRLLSTEADRTIRPLVSRVLQLLLLSVWLKWYAGREHCMTFSHSFSWLVVFILCTNGWFQEQQFNNSLCLLKRMLKIPFSGSTQLSSMQRWNVNFLYIRNSSKVYLAALWTFLGKWFDFCNANTRLLKKKAGRKI